MSKRTDSFVIDPFEPAYRLLGEEALSERLAAALAALTVCRICPHQCGVDRMGEGKGLCETGRYALVTSAFAHFGEEDCLRGRRGSGTIFFGSCNLHCVFCQNYDISQRPAGAPYPPALLAGLMLELQAIGCHNINFVTPSHVVPQVIEAIAEAVPKGLNVPIVYNTSAYDSLETLRLLDGLVDIYMPDIKFWRDETARVFTSASDYATRAREAVLEMHRQVGVLRTGPDGIARRGVLIRHLVMPGLLDESEAIFTWLAEKVSPDTFVNIMGQYRPEHRVGPDTRYALINRRPRPDELKEAHAAARRAGLWRFD